MIDVYTIVVKKVSFTKLILITKFFEQVIHRYIQF